MDSLMCHMSSRAGTVRGILALCSGGGRHFVWSEIVLCLTRVLTEFLRWTVVDTYRIKSDIWWMCSMASGTDRTGVDGFGGDSPVQDPVSWNSRGSGVTLSSAGLYDLDTKRLSDVLGLRAQQPEAYRTSVVFEF